MSPAAPRWTCSVASRVAGAALAALTACSPGGHAPPTTPSSRGASSGIAVDARTVDEVLRDLSAIDRRLAARAHVTPSEDDLRRVTMSAVLHEDPTVAVIDGAIDPFSFDARARGLEAIRQRLGATAPSSAARPASDAELLVRLVDGEIARLDEERRLPRSASALVRAIAETWRPPRTVREVAEYDHWLARRLGEIREAIVPELGAARAAERGAQLDVIRARELDDALDALERFAAAPGFTKTTQELVLLRDALETAAARPGAPPRSEWDIVGGRARAHLGALATPERLAEDLAALEVELRSRADQAIRGAHVDRDALAEGVGKALFPPGPCMDAVPGSRVRSMAAPPEREPACHLRHLAARAAAEPAIALAALHDHVVVALWALDVARGAGTIADAEAKHPLLVPVLADVRARYERVALARPIAAIGAGEVARILARGEPSRAAAWSTIGDTPLDVAERELGD